MTAKRADNKLVWERLKDFLSDGIRHRRDELKQCMHETDPAFWPNALRPHMKKLREEIRPQGLDVVCELDGRAIYYRMVRLLASPYRE